MKFRWSLKALVIAFTLVCFAMAWAAHVRSRHRTLVNAGAQIEYMWENPILSISQSSYGEWIGDVRVIRNEIQNRIATAPAKRSLFTRVRSWFVCDEVRALSIPANAVNRKSTIDSLKNLPHLKFLVLRGAIENTRLADPELTIARLALPNVAVHADNIPR